jgi:hypothetical protein
LIEPPEVGGGRHGYGQSGVSADVVGESTAISRLRKMVRLRERDELCHSSRRAAGGYTRGLDLLIGTYWCYTSGYGVGLAITSFTTRNQTGIRGASYVKCLRAHI